MKKKKENRVMGNSDKSIIVFHFIKKNGSSTTLITIAKSNQRSQIGYHLEIKIYFMLLASKGKHLLTLVTRQ